MKFAFAWTSVTGSASSFNGSAIDLINMLKEMFPDFENSISVSQRSSSLDEAVEEILEAQRINISIDVNIEGKIFVRS